MRKVDLWCLGLGIERGGNFKWAWGLYWDDGNVLYTVTSVNLLKIIELYMWNGRDLLYADYTLIKLFINNFKGNWLLNSGGYLDFAGGETVLCRLDLAVSNHAKGFLSFSKCPSNCWGNLPRSHMLTFPRSFANYKGRTIPCNNLVIITRLKI